jgi:hypothetical protein
MATKEFGRTEGFGDLLRRILIVENRHRLTEVAAALGMTAHCFCRKLRNGGRFSPDNVATLLRVVVDERLPHWFFAGSGLLLVRHSQPLSGNGAMTLHQRAAACAAEAIAAICELADTLELSMLEQRQETMIEQHLDHAQSGLLSIRLKLASPPNEGVDTTDGGAPEDFIHGVRRVLMMDMGVRPHALAEALGLSYHALQDRLSGRVTLLPVELRRLFLGFPDPRLADHLLAGTAYTAILRPAAIDSRIGCSPIRTGLLLLREIVQFLEALLRVENVQDTAVLASAGRHLDEAVRQVAALRWNMTHIGRRAGPSLSDH